MATYGDLMADVSDIYAGDAVPDEALMRAVQARLDRDVRLQDQVKAVTIASDGNAVSLPSDYLGLLSVAIDGAVLTSVSPSRQVGDADAATTYRVGRKAGSVRVGYDLIFSPAIDDGTQADVVYWSLMPRLSSGDDTNTLIELYYDVYLYAACAWMAAYIVDADREQQYESKYRGALREVAAQESASRRSDNHAVPRQYDFLTA